MPQELNIEPEIEQEPETEIEQEPELEGVEDEVKTKSKRILTEKQLETLRLARTKAAKV